MATRLWGYLDVSYSDLPFACAHCGKPTKRAVCMENNETGARVWVGRRCADKLFAEGQEPPR